MDHNRVVFDYNRVHCSQIQLRYGRFQVCYGLLQLLIIPAFIHSFAYTVSLILCLLWSVTCTLFSC